MIDNGNINEKNEWNEICVSGLKEWALKWNDHSYKKKKKKEAHFVVCFVKNSV